ncbi:MAG: ABC transporter ATP-binding protein [Thiohalospira sp.]
MLIEFKAVKKEYGKTKALEDLSFNINTNDFVGLVGNNGCGKTTTIHCMCNLIKYDAGEISVFGRKVEPNYVSYKNMLGILLDKHYFVEEFNVKEYWKFVCKFQGVSKKEANQRIEDLLSLLGLEKDCKMKIQNLSSGNQMKVSLGAALIHNPEILILDEPFIHLDIKTTEKIISILKSFKNKKTLFITSHNLDLIADLCDTFLIMENGKIQMQFKKSEFEDINSLKNTVKKLLAKDNIINDISWLNS